MSISRLLPRCICGVALASVTPFSLAQNSGSSPLTGSVSLGTRSVDVTGTNAKYQEDINLASGVRLFDVSMAYLPTQTDNSIVDSVEFNANNLSGDPFETLNLSVRKYGAYSLKIDRRRSEYFYDDTILPAEIASITGSTGGDFHRFDFERIRDTAALEIQLSPATQVSLGLERQTRTGESETTLDIQRDEFELERPLDESLNALTFGVRHSWQKVSLIFEENLRDFENHGELFLAGASAGQNTADLAQLQFFTLGQAYDYESRSHSLRILADPTARLIVQAAIRRENLDLDMLANEQSEGTSFTGIPFDDIRSGTGAIGRDLEFAEIDVGFAISDRVRVFAGTRSSTLDQQGLLLFTPDQGASRWRIDNDGYELGLEFAPLPNLILTAGWTAETRDTSYGITFDDATVPRVNGADRNGYSVLLMYTNSDGFKLTASAEDNSSDDPFTLASGTDYIRYKVSVRQRWSNGLTIAGSVRRTDIDNAVSGWGSDTEQTALRLSYQRERIQTSIGYTQSNAARDISQLVTAGTRQDLFLIDYDSESDFSDASTRWSINQNISIGGEFRQYDNRGSWPIQRDDVRVFLDVALNESYMLQVNYRDIDYMEDAFDAYDAQILEVAVRLNW